VRHINQPLRGNSSGFFIFCDSKNRILWHFPCTGNCYFWPLLCVSFFSILCLNRHVLNFSVVIIPGFGENISAGYKLPDILVWESLSIKTTIYFTRAAFGDWCYLSFMDVDPTNNRIAAFHWKQTILPKLKLSSRKFRDFNTSLKRKKAHIDFFFFYWLSAFGL